MAGKHPNQPRVTAKIRARPGVWLRSIALVTATTFVVTHVPIPARAQGTGTGVAAAGVFSRSDFFSVDENTFLRGLAGLPPSFTYTPLNASQNFSFDSSDAVTGIDIAQMQFSNQSPCSVEIVYDTANQSGFAGLPLEQL